MQVQHLRLLFTTGEEVAKFKDGPALDTCLVLPAWRALKKWVYPTLAGPCPTARVHARVKMPHLDAVQGAEPLERLFFFQQPRRVAPATAGPARRLAHAGAGGVQSSSAGSGSRTGRPRSGGSS